MKELIPNELDVLLEENNKAIKRLDYEIRLIKSNNLDIVKSYFIKKYNFFNEGIYYGSLYRGRYFYFVITNIAIHDSYSKEEGQDEYYIQVHYREILMSGISKREGWYCIFSKYRDDKRDDITFLCNLSEFKIYYKNIDLDKIIRFHKLQAKININK
jgi:hypothetical protein